MSQEQSLEEFNMQEVREPEFVYRATRRSRIFSEEELSHGISVEESRRRITELIHNHYHPQA